MLLHTPWRGGTSGVPAKLNGSSPLSRSLIFAWAGHLGLDLVKGGRPVNTAVVENAVYGRRGWGFAGNSASSQLDFGVDSATASMALGACTWAFLTQSNDGNLLLAAQNDGNTGNQGWQVGSDRSGQTVIGLEIEASSQNLRKAITQAVPTGPFTVVYTYDGSGTATGLNVYLNGVLGTVGSSANMVGSPAAATQSLLLGKKNYASTGFYNGTIFVSLMAARVWTPAEVSLFHRDPYQAFQHPPAKTFSFGGFVSVQAQGVGGLALDGIGGGTIPSVGGLSLDGVGAGKVIVPGAGVGGFAFDGSGTLHDVGSVGDFDDIPCDCPPGPPLSFPVTPGGTFVGEFEDVDCGCPVSVLGAYAIDGRTVRVVFAEAPLFRSPSGINDAMNPANYLFSVGVGDATAPIATTVSPILVVGPTRYVGNGGATAQRGVDVHVDRPLVDGVGYLISVTGVVTAIGDPTSTSIRPFGGVVLLRQRVPDQRGKPTTLVDIANSVSRGSWFADDSGDIAPEDAMTGYRKRVFRRLTTTKNAFSFLKGYGLGQQLKSAARMAKVAALKTDAEQQIMQEPETAKVTVNVSISALDFVTFSVQAWTKVGAFTSMTVQVAADGTATLVPSPSS